MAVQRVETTTGYAGSNPAVSIPAISKMETVGKGNPPIPLKADTF